jgi:hypothetical protein
MKKNEYVNNKQFYEAIVKYRTEVSKALSEGREEPRIPNYIGECILKIAEKLSTKPCFVNYSFREEMVNDAIENCFLYFKDYNPDHNPKNDPNYNPNPFAYFTQVIYFAFLRRINKEEKMRYTLYKSFQENIIHSVDNSLLVDGDDNHIFPSQMYDNINVFMEKFERKEAIKKSKRQKNKTGLSQYFPKETVDKT